MDLILAVATVHCGLWGLFVVLLPTYSFRVYGIVDPLQHPLLWQGSGYVIVLFGVGYALAWTDPYRHYGLVLLGFLAKLGGSLGVVYGWMMGVMLPQAVYWVFFNDVVWLVPFAVIVFRAFQSDQPVSSEKVVSLVDE